MKKAFLSLVVLCVAANFCTAQTPYESLLLKENNSNVNYFVFFKPYVTTEYITKKLNHHNVNFHTISLYGNKYISATGQNWYIQNLLATFPWNQWYPEIFTEKVEKVEKLVYEKLPNPLSPYELYYNSDFPVIDVDGEENNIECSFGGGLNNDR
ncbi:MAG: hypothetical protein J6W88_03495 [Bacteroidales bacterium]|nr:hypothetical protein [Bacteroidales bacterium]